MFGKLKTCVLASIALFASIQLSARPAEASIIYTCICVGVSHLQTSTTTVVETGANLLAEANLDAPADFTNISVSGPGSTTLNLNFPANPTPFGFQVRSPVQFFTSYGALMAAFPYGEYTFTAENSDTAATQVVTGTYLNALPAATPMLTAESFDGLAGMDPTAAYFFNFNSTSDTGVFFSIVRPGHGLVVSSGILPSSTTQFLLPANTLQAGATYIWNISFYVSTGVGSSPSWGQQASLSTRGSFTTLASTASAPAPGAMALLGLGLTGLLVGRRRHAI